MKTSLINRLCIFLIMGLRPIFGIAHCKYAVSCTQYARIQLGEELIHKAIWNICKRIISCNPL